MLDDMTVWNDEFFVSKVEPLTHGAYYYDLDKNVEIVTNILDYADYGAYNSRDHSNTSIVTMVLKGNTTLSLESDDCAEEGCPGPKLVGSGGAERSFLWSYDMGWNVTGDLAVDVPHEMSDTLIYSTWTVKLDVTTVVMNSLTIMGKLIVQEGNSIEVTSTATS